MGYTVGELAKLSGVSTRTLRYYDQMGLLTPERVCENGYRVYERAQVDRLQQILFYRELGVALKAIDDMLNVPQFDRAAALESHLAALCRKREHLDRLIETVTKTIAEAKGERRMSDGEKFEGFRDKLMADNEARYGKELRERYGEATVNASHAKGRRMSEETFKRAEALRARIDETLAQAFAQGDPAGALAQRACALHKEWLCLFWPDGMYTKQAHRGLGEMYVADERFTAYYDRIAVGCAAFLRDALNVYCA